MSKLLALKEWITLDEAARQLATVFGEEVSIADLYRFALGGHLTLSANFVNHAHAHLGEKLTIREAGFRILPDLDRSGERGLKLSGINAAAMPEFEAWVASSPKVAELLAADEPKMKFVVLNGLQVTDTECLKFDKSKVVTIDGIWDLPMVGAEQLDVEHALQSETGGPPVTLVSLDGTVVNRPNGTFAWLLEHYADNEFASAEMKAGKWDDPRAHYPAGGLPKDAPIVVRPQEIARFVTAISDAERGSEKEIDERERATLLRIIRALDVMAKLHPRGAAAAVELQLEQLGFTKPREATIRKWLDQARSLEPDNAQ